MYTNLINQMHRQGIIALQKMSIILLHQLCITKRSKPNIQLLVSIHMISIV